MSNENKDNSVQDEELHQSSSSLSSDWELLDVDNETGKNNEFNENIENEAKTIPRPSGLFLHSPDKHSGIEELPTDRDKFYHSESNSSSDIDVIDEVPEDNSNVSNSIHSMDISFSHSDISSTVSVSGTDQSPDPIPQNNESEDTDNRPPQPAPLPEENRRSSFGYYFRNAMDLGRLVIDAIHTFQGDRMSTREYVAIFLVMSVVFFPCSQFAFYKANMHKTKLDEMESYVNKLVSENEHLKSKVLEKIEGGKIFGELDEEMKSLRFENVKLQEAMQTVIQQLDRQTHTIKKGLEAQENHRDPYRKEIDNLKGQIAKLRSNNEDLLKRIIRMQLFAKVDNNRNEHKHKDLRDSGIENLKMAGDSLSDEELLDLLEDVKEVAEEFQVKIKEKESATYEKNVGHKKGNYKRENDKHKPKQKNRKFYDWSWKDIHRNVKGTLSKFPDMISKYVVVDKKTVGSVLDTISHYYKKAQDKTRNILDSYSVDERTQNVKNEIWTLMGEMKNKWIDMKNRFMETHFSKRGRKPKKSYDGKSRFSTPTQEDVLNTEEEILEPVEELHPTVTKSHVVQPNQYMGRKKINENDLFEEKDVSYEEKMRQFSEAENTYKTQSKNDDPHESWMFDRAQHRANLREYQDEEDIGSQINWFLKKAELFPGSAEQAEHKKKK